MTAAGAAEKAKLGATFAKAHNDVAASAAQAHGQIAAQSTAQGAALTNWHTGAVAAANASFARGQTRARKAGDDGAQKATTAANRAAATIDSKLKDHSQQAHAIGAQKAGAGGAPEVADAKAKAASKISGDAAQKIGDLGHVTGELRAMAPSTASGLRQKGEEAARAIATGGPQVTAQYGAVHASTAQAMQALTGKGAQSLDQMKAQTAAGLHAHHQRAITGLDQHTAKSAAEIKAAGSHAGAAYRKQGVETMHASEQALGALKQKVAAQPIDPQRAAAAGTQAKAEIQRGFDGIAGKAHAPVDQMTSHISAAGEHAVGGLGKVHGQIQPQVAGVVDHARGSGSKLASGVGSKLAGAMTGARGAGSQMQAQVAAGIDNQVGKVDKAVDKGVGDLQTGLDAKVSEADQKAQQPLNQVGPKIDQAQAKIEADAHKSTLDKVLSWVGDQLKQLGRMLLDPGFWVGLLVAVVLIALLPEELAGLALICAMAAIGAVAAGIGTLVSNIAAGRPPLQNVLQNMLVGALFGGALTFVGAALGTGLVGIAAMMGTAGVLTVIANLATGKPWDEGLLANVLLVGVFAGIAKLFGRPGALRSGKDPKPGDPVTPSDPVEPGKGAGGNGTASEFGDLSNMTRAEADTFLRSRGATVKQTAGGYTEYKFPDKSVVWIRPDGEIVRTPAPKYGPDGRRINKGARLDQNGNPTDSHNTGERVKGDSPSDQPPEDK
ncbi:MAG TPA: hypothetical protein VF516_03895 [Kofleriaceae bacterium]